MAGQTFAGHSPGVDGRPGVASRDADRSASVTRDGFDPPVFYLRKARVIDGAARTEPAPEPAPPRVQPPTLAWIVAVTIFLAVPTVLIIALVTR